MSETTSVSGQPSARAVHLVSEANWPEIRRQLPEIGRIYAESTGFEPVAGRVLVLPGEGDAAGAALLGLGATEGLADQPFLLGKLATDLPGGQWRIEGRVDEPTLAMLGFHLGQYRFDRFRKVARELVHLHPIPGADAARARLVADAVMAGRDLINRPANDLTTESLALAARELAERFQAGFREIIGEALRQENLPMIHAVGAASPHAPRLVDFTWGDARAPKVTLVGKGVVFDTGGLNLKPENSMLLMKKDMAGAAVALAAAEIIMGLQLPVRLRVLLPIVENSVSGAAFRPGDIYRSRAGTTIEIGNTDAEGRLILCDALALADEEKPDLLLDFATLTGAARVALGPDLPPFFTADEALAGAIEAAGQAENDPVWRLPLWKPYRAMLESKAADLNNVSAGPFAGAITAALFLKDFVRETRAYAHFDLYGWNPSAKPGRPEGGEPQVARLAARLVENLFGTASPRS